MTTVQTVFDIAIHMMDEQEEASGKTRTDDTEEYRHRTISIINAIIPALLPFSDMKDVHIGGRSPVPQLWVEEDGEPNFDQLIPLDDTLALGVLPYALAAHLTATENEELSAWFMNRYTMAFSDLRTRIPGTFQPISAPYGYF